MSKPPRPPAHIAAYVEVLGPDMAVEFLLSFGGAELYLPANPRGRSKVEALVGAENVKALQARAGELSARVPTAKPWIAQVFASKGLPVAEIARKLHTTDVTVRKYLRAGPDPRQLSLI